MAKRTENTNEQSRPDWMVGKQIHELAFARSFLRRYPMYCHNGAFYTLQGTMEGEEDLKRLILAEIAPYVHTNLAATVTRLQEALKLLAYGSVPEPQTDRIHVNNGTYMLDQDLLRPELELCLNRLPVDLDLDAPEPLQWLEFLDELLEPKDIQLLQEFMGYCLIPCTKAQKMLVILGSGGEGKSRIGLVLRDLLGSAMNMGSIQKVENNRFARADLENKLLLVDDDLDLNALSKTNYIKTIVTAEAPMDLERKGQQSYQARLYVRFLCFGNGALRSLYDHSEGFYRRQMVIKTKERPKTRVDDPYLSEKLREEKQGILLWCINGLVRLIAMNFQFSQGATRVEQAQELKEDGNNIPQFLASQGYITFRENSTITSKELYRIYSIWCSDNDLPKRSSQSLSSELIQNRGKYHLTYSQRVRNNYGKFVRGFIGIGIAEDDEAESPPENRTLKELL